MMKVLTLDEALAHHIGVGFGQWSQLVLISFGQLPVALIVMLMVFTSLDPVSRGKWECVEPGDSYCMELKGRQTLPNFVDEDFCQMDDSRYFWTDPNFSLISSFNLTCSRGWQVAFLNSMYFLMLVVGGLTFGRVSDKFGRRTALSGGWLLMTVTTALSSIVPNFGAYAVLRVLSAIGLEGVAEANVILSTEQMDPRTRGQAGIMTLVFFILGEILLAAYAWMFTSWRVLTLVVGLTSALFMLSMLVIWESPRWMLLHQQYDRALIVLRNLARWNKRQVDDWVWSALTRTYLTAHEKGVDCEVMERGVAHQHHVEEQASVDAGSKTVAGGVSTSKAPADESQLLLNSPDAGTTGGGGGGGGEAATPARQPGNLLTPGYARSSDLVAASKVSGRSGKASVASMAPSPFENPKAVPPMQELAIDVDDPEEITQHIEVIGPIDAILKGRLVRRYLALMFFILIALQVTYYGSNFAADKFGGSVQFNFLLLALAELPSTLLVALLIDRIGRVVLLFGGLLVGSLASAACGFVGDGGMTQVGLAMLSKFSSSGAWGVLLVYAAEVLPTSVRSTLSGLVSQVGCIGGFLAPYLFYAADKHDYPALPFVAMAIMCKLAAVICTLLPETCGHPQPESLSDMEQLSKNTVTAHLKRWWRKRRGKAKASSWVGGSSSDAQSADHHH